ncbi:MAG: TetR/AcrR family transcriptional regulator [Deltaproteobacteria bacterium]|nr:TetR/AcrR family transcriptional regulator [Deltaproteobacteria bacterium]
MSVRKGKPPSLSTKEQLINAAIKIFQQKGFQKTRISDIVSEAGLAQGTFYLYFESKEKIFRQITLDQSSRFAKVFKETEVVFGGKDLTDIRQNITRFLNKLLEVYKQNIKISELLFRETRGHGGLFKEDQETFYKSFIKLLQEHMKRDLPAGKFIFEDSETIAIFLLGVFLNSTSYFLLMKKQFNTDKLVQKMTDFILNGMQLNNIPFLPSQTST